MGRKRYGSSRSQVPPSLNVKLNHQTLVLVNECTGWTEVGSLFLKADRRKGGAGRLLSQSRYMLIGAQPDLFADNVLAELRGVFTPDGYCPFWDHVAHKFFPMDFDDADRMSGSTDKQFILDLAPRHASRSCSSRNSRRLVAASQFTSDTRRSPSGSGSVVPISIDTMVMALAATVMPTDIPRTLTRLSPG